MSITLNDLKTATETYVDDEVDVNITRITRNLEPGEEGTFDLQITNATETNGFRLDDVVLHLEVAPASKAKLVVPGSALLLPRASTDPNDPRLAANSLVDVMFVFFQEGDFVPNTTLDPGEVLELELEYHAVAAGDATITCHVHATVDLGGLFPRQTGVNGSKSVTVRP